MNDIKLSWRAGIYWNHEFLCVLAQSGRGRVQDDPDSAQHLLSLSVDNETLGLAVQDALAHSRLLTMEEIAAFFNLTNSKARYDAWALSLMGRYGYKTRRALFRRMLICGARQQDDIITFSPSRKDRLEAWEGLGKEAQVEVATNSNAAEIGAALRLAMSRSC